MCIRLADRRHFFSAHADSRASHWCVTGVVWLYSALEVLQNVGMNVPGVVDAPLLPAPDGKTSFLLDRALLSTETSEALRRFVGAEHQVHSDGGFAISSHSAKATCLSWSAKFGLSSSTRSLLGRHTSAANETFAMYSRELMVSPVAE